jgi:hypothetical protein
MSSSLGQSMSVKSKLAMASSAIAASILMVSCGMSGGSHGEASSELFAPHPQNFRLSLTDAPNDDLKSVFVMVKHAEILMRARGKEGRVQVARGLGSIDLLTLQNGLTLPMADLTLPYDVEVYQIRLVLENSGHHTIHRNGARCDLRTPSQERSGIKLLIKNGVAIERGFSYSIVADFDAKKSVVSLGQGDCLLKPVLKLYSATRISPGSSAVEPANPAPGSGSHDEGARDFDTAEESELPPVIEEEELEDYFDH